MSLPPNHSGATNLLLQNVEISASLARRNDNEMNKGSGDKFGRFPRSRGRREGGRKEGRKPFLAILESSRAGSTARRRGKVGPKQSLPSFGFSATIYLFPPNPKPNILQKRAKCRNIHRNAKNWVVNIVNKYKRDYFCRHSETFFFQRNCFFSSKGRHYFTSAEICAET